MRRFMKYKKYLLLFAEAVLMLFAFLAESEALLYHLMDFSLSPRYGVGNLMDMIFPHTVYTGLLALMFFLMAFYAPKERIAAWEKLFCVFLSTGLIFGHSLHQTHSLAPVFSRKICMLAAVVILAGLSVLCVCVWKWLKFFGKKLVLIKVIETKAFAAHPFWMPFALILAAWLPFILLRYPAGIEFDAYYQMEMFLGFVPMSAHWPVFSSVLMGFFVWLGEALFGSYNAGAFLFVLFQSAVSAAVLAYTLITLKKFGVSVLFRRICLGIYAFSTIFAGYLTSILKDALFSIAVLLFVTLWAEEFFLPQNRKRTVCLGLTALFMCLLRNNGMLILGVSLVAFGIIITIKKQKKCLSIVAAMLCALLLFVGYQNLLIPALGIQKGSAGESFSVQFQQTARYVKMHPEDVTEKERAVIDAVLDYDALADLYDPTVSDPVKATYHGDAASLRVYLTVWLKHLFRHPLTYAEATLANTYGYFYPGAKNTVLYTDTRSCHVLQFEEPSFLILPKDMLFSYVSFAESLPIFMFLASAGAHFWLAMYLLFRSLAMRDLRALLLLLPSLVTMAICIGSPTYVVNGVRYALPMIYANPFLLSLIFGKRKEDSSKTLNNS